MFSFIHEHARSYRQKREHHERCHDLATALHEHAADGLQATHVARDLDQAHQTDDANRIVERIRGRQKEDEERRKPRKEIDDAHEREDVAHACARWRKGGIDQIGDPNAASIFSSEGDHRKHAES